MEGLETRLFISLGACPGVCTEASCTVPPGTGAFKDVGYRSFGIVNHSSCARPASSSSKKSNQTIRDQVGEGFRVAQRDCPLFVSLPPPALCARAGAGVLDRSDALADGLFTQDPLVPFWSSKFL